MEAEKILGMLRVMGISMRSAAGSSINASIQKRSAVDIQKIKHPKNKSRFIQDRFAFLN
jgi:hypothetical protein